MPGKIWGAVRSAVSWVAGSANRADEEKDPLGWLDDESGIKTVKTRAVLVKKPSSDATVGPQTANTGVQKRHRKKKQKAEIKKDAETARAALSSTPIVAVRGLVRQRRTRENKRALADDGRGLGLSMESQTALPDSPASVIERLSPSVPGAQKIIPHYKLQRPKPIDTSKFGKGAGQKDICEFVAGEINPSVTNSSSKGFVVEKISAEADHVAQAGSSEGDNDDESVSLAVVPSAGDPQNLGAKVSEDENDLEEERLMSLLTPFKSVIPMPKSFLMSRDDQKAMDESSVYAGSEPSPLLLPVSAASIVSAVPTIRLPFEHFGFGGLGSQQPSNTSPSSPAAEVRHSPSMTTSVSRSLIRPHSQYNGQLMMTQRSLGAGITASVVDQASTVIPSSRPQYRLFS